MYHGSPDATAMMQGGNRYVYGLNNPVRYCDPSGQSSAIFEWSRDTYRALSESDGPGVEMDLVGAGFAGAGYIIGGFVLLAETVEENSEREITSEYLIANDSNATKILISEELPV